MHAHNQARLGPIQQVLFAKPDTEPIWGGLFGLSQYIAIILLK